ncbi:hypothetical protein M409DRAFT_17537 [Zasmidium cellare ATCC 36951]|uniref:Uncharacterized protein n=1 Tax=Zasmidium cellare ATCC 36951 TaxID=1080233 RepID=A0A6A6D288_ZASCE|nr:uncharacterized protein M409DRAFT_17537 [Zasmidium cellare ATCC 36951]KAF2172302.1 hypothetical protein M409DRAFT_17537 [Zasmidium cellare ATCC 36951]
MASKKNATSGKASQMSQEKKAQEERNAAKRHHEYVHSDLQPKGRLLRIHTREDITWSMPGRIIKQWVDCRKPMSEPNRGCRTGRMGFWVETEEGFKAVLICRRKVCDWGAGEVDEGEHEMEGQEGEEGESDNSA